MKARPFLLVVVALSLGVARAGEFFDRDPALKEVWEAQDAFLKLSRPPEYRLRSETGLVGLAKGLTRSQVVLKGDWKTFAGTRERKLLWQALEPYLNQERYSRDASILVAGSASPAPYYVLHDGLTDEAAIRSEVRHASNRIIPVVYAGIEGSFPKYLGDGEQLKMWAEFDQQKSIPRTREISCLISVERVGRLSGLMPGEREKSEVLTDMCLLAWVDRALAALQMQQPPDYDDFWREFRVAMKARLELKRDNAQFLPYFRALLAVTGARPYEHKLQLTVCGRSLVDYLGSQVSEASLKILLEAWGDDLLNDDGRQYIAQKLSSPDWRKALQECKTKLSIDAELLKEPKPAPLRSGEFFYHDPALKQIWETQEAFLKLPRPPAYKTETVRKTADGGDGAQGRVVLQGDWKTFAETRQPPLLFIALEPLLDNPQHKLNGALVLAAMDPRNKPYPLVFLKDNADLREHIDLLRRDYILAYRHLDLYAKYLESDAQRDSWADFQDKTMKEREQVACVQAVTRVGRISTVTPSKDDHERVLTDSGVLVWTHWTLMMVRLGIARDDALYCNAFLATMKTRVQRKMDNQPYRLTALPRGFEDAVGRAGRQPAE